MGPGWWPWPCPRFTLTSLSTARAPSGMFHCAPTPHPEVVPVDGGWERREGLPHCSALGADAGSWGVQSHQEGLHPDGRGAEWQGQELSEWQGQEPRP